MNKARQLFTVRPIVVCGNAEKSKDEGELTNVRCAAAEKHLSVKEFTNDAGHGPDIDGRSEIERGAKEKLRGTVAESDDLGGEDLILKPPHTAHAEITNFEGAMAVNEEVGRFKVAMSDPTMMEVIEAEKSLKSIRFDVGER